MRRYFCRSDCTTYTKVNERLNRHSLRDFVAFEVPTAVYMKCTIRWGVITCNLIVHRRFGGTYCLHLQDLRVSQTTSKNHCLLNSGYLLDVLFYLEDVCCMFLRNFSKRLSDYTSPHLREDSTLNFKSSNLSATQIDLKI
jgi:hypothetical protein